MSLAKNSGSSLYIVVVVVSKCNVVLNESIIIDLFNTVVFRVLVHQSQFFFLIFEQESL